MIMVNFYKDALADLAPMAGLNFSIVGVDMFSIPVKDGLHISTVVLFQNEIGSLFGRGQCQL